MGTPLILTVGASNTVLLNGDNAQTVTSTLSVTHVFTNLARRGMACLTFASSGTDDISAFNILTSSQDNSNPSPYTNSALVLRRQGTALNTPSTLQPETTAGFTLPLPSGTTFQVFMNLEGVQELAIEAATASGTAVLDVGICLSSERVI